MKLPDTYQQKVFDKVKKNGGFSIFWVSDNKRIAEAADRLVKKGIIIADGDANFPWCRYKINEDVE